MPVQRLNHAVLYVRDAAQSAAFYQEMLGFREVFRIGEFAVFMQAPGSDNDHDLAVMTVGQDSADSTAGRGSVGLYHVAWEVDTLSELQRLRTRLAERGALVGESDHGTTKALYARDPDGLEFELSWILPAVRITEQDLEARGQRPSPLDLDAEIARFGPELASAGVQR